MKISLLLFIAVSFATVNLSAQNFSRSVNDAYLITRMAEKFHFQPRPLNDRFSADLFTKFFNDLDGEKIFFTAADFNSFQKYKYQLDDEIRQMQPQFLQAFSALYETRLTQVQGMIDDICKTPFNFYYQEKFTIAEDTSYPSNVTELHNKISKIIRVALLNAVVKNNDIHSLSIADKNKYLKKTEPEMRMKIRDAFKHSINALLQSPGGLQKIIGNEYCKAIALCYDPHTEYLPVNEKENFETELGRKNVTLGFTLRADGRGNVFINELQPGSPAYKSGQINRGDKILSIQWEGLAPVDLSGAGIKEIEDELNANNNGNLILTLKKADGSKRVVTLLKEKMEAGVDDSKVKSFLLKGEKIIGYISLPAFYEDWESDKGINGCANDVAKEIVKLKKENIQGLILDVRFNSGGSIQEAIELAGIFIDAGPVAQYKERDGTITTLKDINKGTIYDGPLLLLVNGYSASASEMVAAALQDYNRAVIIGSPTYGKATTQAILPLDTTITRETDVAKKTADSYLKLTIAEIYRVTGKPIQSIGVMPDISIPEILPLREKDNAFVLAAPAVKANKYYIPEEPLSFKKINADAKKQIESSGYFNQLEKYIENEKKSQVKQDVSLRLADALSLQNNALPVADTSVTKNNFKVDNHSYDNTRLKLNKSRKKMNDDWCKNISQDEYIKLAYNLINTNN